MKRATATVGDGAIECPRCGARSDEPRILGRPAFYFVEEVTTYRGVEGVDPSGGLTVAGAEEPWPDDASSDPRLLCYGCGQVLALPAGATWSFEG